MTPEEEKQWREFRDAHSNIRCCDCKWSKPHPRGNEYYTHVCTFHKRDGITIAHKGDERVWCSTYEERKER